MCSGSILNAQVSTFEASKNKADQCFDSKDYDCAIENYKKCLRLKSKDAFCIERLKKAESLKKEQETKLKKETAQTDAVRDSLVKALRFCEMQDYKAFYDLIRQYESSIAACPSFIPKEDCAALQMYLGYVLLNGKGTAMDVSQAKVWYTRSAENGNQEAQLKMGGFYENGQAFEQNLIKAYQYYEMAGKTDGTANEHATRVKEKIYQKALEDYDIKKFDEALSLATYFVNEGADCQNPSEMKCETLQMFIADMYYGGKGTVKNVPEAKKYWTMAAKHGSKRAMTTLAKVLYNEKNYKEALSLLNEAAEKGDHSAMGLIGRMYFEGKGVPKDNCLANEWLQKAVDGGDEDAKRFLSRANITQKIFFDNNWKLTTFLLNPTYYRIIHLCPDKAPFLAEDFYNNGTLQKKGYYLTSPDAKFDSLNYPYRDGKFEYFRSNGNRDKVADYRKGLLHGTFTQYLEDGSIEFVSTYNDGKLVKTERQNKFTVSNRSSRTFVFELNDEGTGWHSYRLNAGYDNSFWAPARSTCKYRIKLENGIQEGVFEQKKIYQIGWNEVQKKWDIVTK